jgi:hypothetical protein
LAKHNGWQSFVTPDESWLYCRTDHESRVPVEGYQFDSGWRHFQVYQADDTQEGTCAVSAIEIQIGFNSIVEVMPRSPYTDNTLADKRHAMPRMGLSAVARNCIRVQPHTNLGGAILLSATMTASSINCFDCQFLHSDRSYFKF